MPKHPWYRLTLSLRLSCFHSHQCQQFHHVSSMDTPTYSTLPLGHCIRTSPVQPTGFFHQQVHHFRLAPLLSRDPGVFCLGTTADIRTDPFQYSITSIDRHTGCRIWQVVFKTCGNLCFILHIGSRGCQRHGRTLNLNALTCFKQEVCYVDGDRDTPQNHGSWISRELWRREPEMINPGKSHAHRSWKNLKFQILIHQNMPHWTATIIVIAGEKLLSKRLWHRLRPPASVVLDVHRGLRRQQQLGELHVVVECCKMQRSPTSAPQASEAPPAAAPGGFWAPAASELPGQYIINHIWFEVDQHSHCPLFTLVHRYPRRVPSANVKEKDELQNYCTCFNKMCCVDRDRDTPQNHGSWISGELWRREPEMINPGKSHAHRSWKNLKFQILIHQNMPHWTATIIDDCRWKTVFKTVATSAEAPGRLLSLTSTEAFAASSSLALSTLAVDCCIMQRSPTSAPPASEHHPLRLSGRLLSSRAGCCSRTSTGRALRQEKGDDRRVVEQSAACVQRGLAARGTPWTRRRVGPGSAGRGAGGPARPPGSPKASRQGMMLSSRRAEKCSKNEVPHFLRSSCSIFSTSPSLLLMEIIWNKLETELIELL